MSETNQNTGGNFSFTPYISEVKGELQGTETQERLELIETKLPGLSDINANEPGEGYRNFKLLSESHSESQLTNHLLKSASKVIHFEYIYEKPEIIQNIHEGELVNVETLTAHLVDIYWFGDIMLLSGRSEDTSKARNRLQSELVGELRIKKVSFSTEVLNNILSGKYDQGLLNEKKPEITDIRSLTAKGNENVSQVSIHGGKKIKTYEKYLEDTSKVTQMIANFKYFDYLILANISETNIHVYSVTPSESLDNKEKLLVSVLFSVAFLTSFHSSRSRLAK
ncbi:hypothetical protein [Natrarchaeobaculum sulfurireducens]|uniref:Uncharacterized protein n=1 Tax=Natrarchaeobaculum sulfurireducens TaxID=2044521 RepID=A0A346PG52_9EURY|nr:hypothetical protein [Natrarchaeobaculum sulfurireducens]AXR78497.1 hypothetical protein AArc1_2181 [Natrarchaeobaculum sulfurireducens]